MLLEDFLELVSSFTEAINNFTVPIKLCKVQKYWFNFICIFLKKHINILISWHNLLNPPPMIIPFI